MERAKTCRVRLAVPVVIWAETAAVPRFLARRSRRIGVPGAIAPTGSHASGALWASQHSDARGLRLRAVPVNPDGPLACWVCAATGAIARRRSTPRRRDGSPRARRWNPSPGRAAASGPARPRGPDQFEPGLVNSAQLSLVSVPKQFA